VREVVSRDLTCTGNGVIGMGLPRPFLIAFTFPSCEESRISIPCSMNSEKFLAKPLGHSAPLPSDHMCISQYPRRFAQHSCTGAVDLGTLLVSVNPIVIISHVCVMSIPYAPTHIDVYSNSTQLLEAASAPASYSKWLGMG